MRMDVLGPLTQHDGMPEWLVSSAIAIPMFGDARLRFVFVDRDDERPHELASAVERFLALTTRDRDAAASYVFMNYREVSEAFDDDIGVRIDGPGDVWDHVQLDEIFVSRRSRDNKVYVQLTAECAWEPEHGLQIVYRDGAELSRVSQQDGHLSHVDANDVPESEDRIV